MADTKISALTVATTPLAGTEVLPIVQGGVTKQVSIANLTAGRAVSAASLTLTTTPLAVTSGGTGLASLTANQVLYGSFSQSSNLFFDGTILGVGTSSPSGFATRLGIQNGTVVCAASSTSYTAYFGVQNDLNYNGGMALRPSNYSTYGVITANCLNFYYGSGDIAIAADGSNNIKFGTGNSVPNRMQIFASGGVSIGNTTDPGASNLSVTGKSIAAKFQTISNTASIAGSATATVLTLSSSVTGTYYVTADFGGQGNEIYSGMAIIVANAGSFRIVTNGGGTRSAISLSGANVQITNALGVALTAYAAAMFVGY